MNMINSIIVEGEVMAIKSMNMKIKNVNRFGSACVICENVPKQLEFGVGDTVRVIGTLMGDVVYVEHMEVKPCKNMSRP